MKLTLIFGLHNSQLVALNRTTLVKLWVGIHFISSSVELHCFHTTGELCEIGRLWIKPIIEQTGAYQLLIHYLQSAKSHLHEAHLGESNDIKQNCSMLTNCQVKRKSVSKSRRRWAGSKWTASADKRKVMPLQQAGFLRIDIAWQTIS